MPAWSYMRRIDKGLLQKIAGNDFKATANFLSWEVVLAHVISHGRCNAHGDFDTGCIAAIGKVENRLCLVRPVSNHLAAKATMIFLAQLSDTRTFLWSFVETHHVFLVHAVLNGRTLIFLLTRGKQSPIAIQGAYAYNRFSKACALANF